jgi:hypothetical protein
MRAIEVAQPFGPTGAGRGQLAGAEAPADVGAERCRKETVRPLEVPAGVFVMAAGIG